MSPLALLVASWNQDLLQFSLCCLVHVCAAGDLRVIGLKFRFNGNMFRMDMGFYMGIVLDKIPVRWA